MPDILASAQAQIDEATSQLTGSPPPALLKEEALLPPSPPSQKTDPVLNELDIPFSSHAEAPKPPSALPEEPVPASIVPPASRRTSRHIGVLTAVIVLFITLPLSAYFVSQQRKLTDQRSKAAYVTTANQLYIANLDKTSFSVIWKEQNPAKGCAIAKNTKLQKETKVCDDSLSRVHLITLTNLDQYTPHEVVTQGSEKILLHPFFGGTILTGLFDKNKPPSQRVQGKILNQNNQPIKNSIVVIMPLLTDRFYFPLAATTDQNGVYVIDLSLIKAQTAKPVETYVVEVIDLQGKTLIEQKVNAPSGDQMSVVTVP